MRGGYPNMGMAPIVRISGRIFRLRGFPPRGSIVYRGPYAPKGAGSGAEGGSPHDQKAPRQKIRSGLAAPPNYNAP